MLNIGGGEFLIIFLVALVVLGPTKLPEAARQVGKMVGEFRKISSGFQREFKSALEDPVERVTREARKDVTSIASPPVTSEEQTRESTSTAAGVADAADEVEQPALPNEPDPPMHGDR